MKSGFVSIVGRPNVGKSTLLNSLLETKLAITSNKAGTTRNLIHGIYRDEDCQIVFVDTPGIHKPLNQLGNLLNRKAYEVTNDVDLILFLVDVSTGFGKGDEFILNRLKGTQTPVILILNKIDKIKKEQLLHVIDQLQHVFSFAEIVPVSALTGDNVTHLLGVIKPYLTNDGPLYDDETFTNISNNFYMSEIIREKVLRLTEKEVPHAVTCLIEHVEEKEDVTYIQALIIVDRDNLKKIIIGKHGQMLKEIGILARVDLEEYLHTKVYLELFVKTVSNWRDRDKYLLEFGLKEE